MAGELQQIVSSEITMIDVTDGSTLVTYFTNNKHGSLNFSYDPDSGEYTPKFPTIEQKGEDYPLVLKPECYRSIEPNKQLIDGGISTDPGSLNEFYSKTSAHNYTWFIDGTMLLFADAPDSEKLAISATETVVVKSCITAGYESVKCDGTNLIVFRNSNILGPNNTSTGIKFQFDYLDPVFEGVLDENGDLLQGVPVAMSTSVTLNKQGVGRNYIDMYCTPSNYFYNAAADEVININADAYKNGIVQERDGLLPGEMVWGYTGAGETGKIVKSFWWYYDDIDNMFLPLNVAGDGVGDVTTDRVDGDNYKPTTDVNQGETDTVDSYGVDPSSTFNVLMIREKIVYGSEIFQYACRFKDSPTQEYRATQVVIDYTDPLIVTVESDSGNIFKYGANNNKRVRAIVKEKESSTSSTAGEYIELSDEQAMAKYNFRWVLFNKDGVKVNAKAPKQKGDSDTGFYRWINGVLSMVNSGADEGFTDLGEYNNCVCYVSRADINITGNLRVSVSKKPETKQTLRSFLKL